MRTVTTKYPMASHSADLILRTENVKDYTVSFSHLCPGLAWCFFHSGLPTKMHITKSV